MFNPAGLMLRVLALLLLSIAGGDAHGSVLDALGEMDSKARLWLAAVGGLSLGIAGGALVLELRSRATAVALRRMTDLATGVDGRMPEYSERQSVPRELGRLSDELLYTTQRVARERRDHAAQLAAWEAVFAASLDATLLLDAEGAITRVNPAAERLFRVTADDVIGKRFVDVALPPSHRSQDNAAFASDLASGKAQGRRQELVAQRSDGRQFPLEVAVAEFGQPNPGFVITAHDISAVRRARAALARAREQLDSPRLEAPSKAAAAAKAPARLDQGPVHEAPSFTIDETCGELVRKLAGRAERRGLRFRYEDGEVQGLALRGDSSRLRRTLINLIDSVIKVVDAGELIVHLIAVPSDGQQIEVMVAVTATAMSDAQAGRMIKPFITNDVTRRDASPYPGRATTDRHIDFLGTRVTLMRTAGGGSTFRFGQAFDADLSRVAIDLGSLAALPSKPASRHADVRSGTDAQRAAIEFGRAAGRLRKNAERANLIALWAEAHRLHALWLRHGDPAQPGLVTALAHTARGGDAVNAVALARRFADSLEIFAASAKPAASAKALAA